MIEVEMPEECWPSPTRHNNELLVYHPWSQRVRDYLIARRYSRWKHFGCLGRHDAFFGRRWFKPVEQEMLQRGLRPPGFYSTDFTRDDQEMALWHRSAAGVYLIRSGEYVKIGMTTDIRRRVYALDEGQPEPVALVGWMETLDGSVASDLERRLHFKFSKLRVRYEWFLWCPAIEAFAATTWRLPVGQPVNGEFLGCAEFRAYMRAHKSKRRIPGLFNDTPTRRFLALHRPV